MKKKTQKITLVIIIIFLISYLATAFLMRNKSAQWCKLSFGTYDVTGFAIHDIGMEGATTNTYGCNGGLFN